MSALPPGPGRLATLGILRGFYTDALGMLEQLQAEHGDVVRVPVADEMVWLVAHPDHVGWILKDNQKSYTKGAVYDHVRPLLGSGLVTAEGEAWKRQRRLLQPAFHVAQLAEVGRITGEEVARLLLDWKAGEVRNVAQDANGMSFRVACRTLFGADPDVDLAEVDRHFAAVMRAAVVRSRQIVRLPLRVPAPNNVRYTRSLRWLDAFVYGLIGRRRAEPGERTDLLGLLLRAVDEESGRGLDDTALRDEVLSFLFAGHETTANSLAWALYLLAANPAWQERLHAEVAALGHAPAMSDLPALPLCRRVLDETLRLYPPAWWLERRAIADDTLGAWHVPAGTRVALSTWLTHRHPGFWEEPSRFDPDRFLPARAEGRHRHAYYPFAAGPRGCIGAGSAMVTLTIALATIVGRWRVAPVPERPVRLEPLLAVRSATGVHLRMERRA